MGKILITGRSGKLGRELLKVYPEVCAPTHEEMDITKYPDVESYLSKTEPELLIHTAALTSVRKCEKFRRRAWAINVEGTRNLVWACRIHCPRVYFVYISTACIFSGEEGNYDEFCEPDPENHYGLTKLVGECIPRELEKWLVVRTNFVAKKPWPYPKAFTDRYGTYLFSEDVAKAMKEIIDVNLTGVVHITGGKKMSMFQLAKMVSPDVEPMTMDEYAGPSLTVDMTLDSARWKKYRISEVAKQSNPPPL